jgi:Ca2+-binding EF-hand superfamily protein
MVKFCGLALLLCSGVLSSDPTAERRQQFSSEFRNSDSDADGWLDPTEMRMLFPDISQADLSAFFIAADGDQDGLITLEEYIVVRQLKQEGQLDLNDFRLY